MIRKRGDLTINQLILIILALLVLVFAVVFVLRGSSILEWIKSLPDYVYKDAPDVSDIKIDEAVAKSICLNENPVGFIGSLNALSFGAGGDYISFYYKLDDGTGRLGRIPTKLYWKGNKKSGEIYLKQTDFTVFGRTFTADWFVEDLLIATVKDGKVSVETNLLDYNSKIYQTTRFLKERPPELLFVSELDNAHIVEANKLCRAGEKIWMVPAWPGEGKIIDLDLKMYVDPETGKVVTQLDDWFELVGKRKARFLFLENAEDFIYVDGLLVVAPLRIYPDSSVWLYHENGLTAKSGAGVITQENKHLSKLIPGFLETNLRVDYYKIRALVESGIEEGFIEPRETDKDFDGKCTVKVAKILKGGKMKLCTDRWCLAYVDPDILWTGTLENMKIEIDWIQIGDMNNNLLDINDEIVKREGSLYNQVKNKLLPDQSFIVNLDGSQFISGYLCRKDYIISGYSGTTVDKTLLGNIVKMVYDDGEGRCRATEVISGGKWLSNYGLKVSEKELEYYEIEGWKNVDDKIPNEEDIKLRNSLMGLKEKVSALKIKYGGTDYSLHLNSKTGIYFIDSHENSYIYHPDFDKRMIVVEKISSSGVKTYEFGLIESFKSVLSSAELDLKNIGTTPSPYYLLGETTFTLSGEEVGSYGIDSVMENNEVKNMFYSSDGQLWKKYDKGEYYYLYVKESEWEHMKMRKPIKDELIVKCK